MHFEENAFKDKGAGRALATSYLAKDPDPYALTLLEWALQDNRAMVRAAAAKELGERGNQSSIDKLASLLKDSRTAVRNMAAASIIRLSANGEAPKGQASLEPPLQPEMRKRELRRRSSHKVPGIKLHFILDKMLPAGQCASFAGAAPGFNICSRALTIRGAASGPTEFTSPYHSFVAF